MSAELFVLRGMGLGDDHPFIVLGLGFRVLGCVGWHLSRALSSLLLLLLCPLPPESLCSLMTDEDIVGLPPGAVLQMTISEFSQWVLTFGARGIIRNLDEGILSSRHLDVTAARTHSKLCQASATGVLLDVSVRQATTLSALL
jgi:hypothetical protein